MKKITFLIFILLNFLILKAQAVTTLITNCTGTYGGTHACSEDSYFNDMIQIWNINTGVNNKPVLIECNMDVEWSDVLYIYAVDNSGNEHLVATKWGGVVSYEYISTGLPTGKAKVVFVTDSWGCADPNDGGWFGVESYYMVDNSYTGTAFSTSYTGTSTVETAIIVDSLTVGTPVNPAKKVMIYAPRITQSSSDYETVHTMDNSGYRININTSIINSYACNFRVAIAGVDRFKILGRENYSFGANSLTSITKWTAGRDNFGFGAYSLSGNTAGNYNIGIGHSSLKNNTTGSHNIAFGYHSLYGNTTGSYNIGIGYGAGGTTTNKTGTNSIFLGDNARAQADGQTNQTVIGYGAVGNGSNSVTLGSDAVTKTILKGNVGIGTVTPEYKLDVAGSIRTSGEFVTNEMTVSKSNSEIGGTLTLANPAKTDAGAASSWRIMNMSGTYGNSLQFWAYDNAGCPNGLCAPRLVLMDNGNVGIGTSTPDELLTVGGTLHAKKVKIDLASPLADYVFSPEYRLMSLSEIERFVKANRHLPDVPSAAEVQETGIDMGEFQNLLLQKIEELTLHTIEQQKVIERQGAEIEKLKRKMK